MTEAKQVAAYKPWRLAYLTSVDGLQSSVTGMKYLKTTLPGVENGSIFNPLLGNL